MTIAIGRLTVLSFTIFSLVGCAGFLNEGATRVRYTGPNSSQDNGSVQSKFTGIYLTPKYGTETIVNGNDQQNIIKENEYFSISLLSAHICGFRESSFFGYN